MQNILVVAAHPDDEILGCGATIAKHKYNGDKCFVLVLGEGITSRYNKKEIVDNQNIQELHSDTIKAAKIIGYKKVFFENIPDNRFDSVDLLDIIKVIERYVDEIKPDVIYTHHGGDLNIDHQLTLKAVLTATRPIGKNYVKEVYAFETVSSSEWNFEYDNSFKPDYFSDISDYIDIKLRAMECYKSELRDFPHPRSIDNLKYTASKWGTLISRQYVEAFKVMRIIK